MKANAFFIDLSGATSFCILLFSHIFFSQLVIGIEACGAGVFGLIGCISLSLSLALPTSNINDDNNNNSQNIDLNYKFGVKVDMGNTVMTVEEMNLHSFLMNER